ncbi:hypothetical protein JR316_0003981 [Psilocybe cubensis]|uniref:F-box domain-containing protein n=2 Tax=Psilocybe cubensis TaxID=181762 RepID=A0A8H7Y6M5_PSICU|nr:hypothetical protein JR316_0003981 [Psilocybe cubensis]KAH9484499.1 hypothetical protein JR316_0003981 [Psilocybe cubensis]
MPDYISRWKGEHLASSKAYKACDLRDGNPCPPCLEAIELEKEVEAARQALNNLLEKKNDMLININRYHDPLCSRLPPEITSKIFECYRDLLEDERENTSTVYRRREPLILRLGAVCKAWRDIAWSSPFVWNHLRIYPTKSATQLYNDGVEQWLKRAGGLPLFLSIKLNEFRTKHPINDRLMAIINRYSHQWREFSLECHPDHLVMFSGNSNGAPLLSRLSIDLCVTNPPPTAQFCLPSMEPRPIYVKLSSVSLTRLVMKWDNVTHVHFSSIALHELRTPFQQATRLIKCYLGSTGRVDQASLESRISSASRQSRITSPLKSLFLQHYSGQEVLLLFQMFSFPKLSILELVAIRKVDINSLFSTLNPTSIHLKQLTLNLLNSTVQTQILLGALQRFPSLENLTLNSKTPKDLLHTIGNNFVANKSGDFYPTILPNLKDFTLHITSEWDIDLWRLIPRIFGPWTEGDNSSNRSNLKRVSIISSDNQPQICVEKDVLERLLELGRSRFHLTAWKYGDLIEASIIYHGL